VEGQPWFADGIDGVVLVGPVGDFAVQGCGPELRGACGFGASNDAPKMVVLMRCSQS
jgi:hypothetical protein